MKDVVGFLEKCHTDAILTASEATSLKKKRKTAKKHSERMAKKFKASREHQDTYTEEPEAYEATFIGTASGIIVPSKARLLTIVNSSFIPTTTLHSSISFPHTSLQGFSIPSTTLSYNLPYVQEPILFKHILTPFPLIVDPSLKIECKGD